MSKHAAVQFNRKLSKLFDQYTFWLRKAVDKGSLGRPPKVNRAKISKSIKQLQDLASEATCMSFAKEQFQRIVKQKKQWQVKTSKGWGRREKKKSFDHWFKKHINHPNCIYIFWKNKNAVYVGRTIKGKSRPQNHFSEVWFPKVTRIDIFSTTSPTEVSKLECLAIHRFDPVENRMKASRPKSAKRCPVCVLRKEIKSELRNIFRLRK
jgi:hypothetical protein